MPKPKPDLRLDDIWDDDEIDVGTVRTSFSLTNVASALVPDATPVKGARQHSAHSKRASLGWGSPSSPSLLLGARKSSLSRSQTLPRTASVRSRRPSILDSLSVDTTVADKMRRWILGIAVGAYCPYHPQPANPIGDLPPSTQSTSTSTTAPSSTASTRRFSSTPTRSRTC